MNPISSRAFWVCDERSYVEKGSRSDVEGVDTLATVEDSIAVVVGAAGVADEEVEASLEEEVSVDESSFVGEDVVSSLDFSEEEEPFNFDLLFFFDIDFDISAAAAMVYQV